MSEYTPEKLREWAEHKAQRPSGSFYSCPCLSAGTAKLTDQLRAHADALEKLKVAEEALRGVIRVADRATVEFDKARAALAAIRGK